MSPRDGISYGVVVAYILESVLTEGNQNFWREVAMKDVAKFSRSTKAERQPKIMIQQ